VTTEPSIIGYQLKNLGDTLMCLPALALIKEKYPQTRTALVTRPLAKELLEIFPLLDTLYVTGHKPRRFYLSSTLELAKRIRSEGFGLALGFDHKRRSGILSLLSGQKRRLSSYIPGYEEPRWPWKRLPKWSGPREPMHTHMALSQVALAAAAIGVDFDFTLKPEWFPKAQSLDSRCEESAQKLLESDSGYEGRAPLVGFCLSGQQPEKSWPLRYFSEVATALHKTHGARFYVTGTYSDSTLCQSLMTLTQAPITDLCGKTTLMELLSVLKRLSLFISIDTGSVHMAALVDTPLVCVYTASNPLQWAPLMDGRLMRLLSYDLVMRRYGIMDTYGLFESRPFVSPGDVIDAATELLQSGKD
jgi:ADP-heptose:LPS heptosyltransferase